MIVAIDLGGSKCAIALGQPDGTVLARARFATRPDRGPEVVIAEMIATVNQLREQVAGTLFRINVASVGPFDPVSGHLLSPPNFPGWDAVPLRHRLQEAFGVGVGIENDANAAAWGEFKLGAGRGSNAMLYVTVSTGIGCGLVLNGRLWRGFRSGAGELGHQTVMPFGGPSCGCGNEGCLEALASGTAIVRAAAERLDHVRTPELWRLCRGDRQALRATDVAVAAAAGEPEARRIWETAVTWLGVGLANAINIVSPDCLIIGGGVAHAGDALIAPLRLALRQRVRLMPIDRMELRTATLGDDAGLMGALVLPEPEVDSF